VVSFGAAAESIFIEELSAAGFTESAATFVAESAEAAAAGSTPLLLQAAMVAVIANTPKNALIENFFIWKLFYDF
jgi:hypothetical protein